MINDMMMYLLLSYGTRTLGCRVLQNQKEQTHGPLLGCLIDTFYHTLAGEHNCRFHRSPRCEMIRIPASSV